MSNKLDLNWAKSIPDKLLQSRFSTFAPYRKSTLFCKPEVTLGKESHSQIPLFDFPTEAKEELSSSDSAKYAAINRPSIAIESIDPIV